MNPEDAGQDDLEARLRAELDAVHLAAPLVAQARYRQAPAPTGGAFRRLGPMLAGAAVAVFLIGFAAAALNPSIWRSRNVGSPQHVIQPAGAERTPSPTPRATQTGPTPNASGPAVSPESGSGDHSGGTEPAASPTPESDGGTSDGGGTSGEASPQPSPLASPLADQ